MGTKGWHNDAIMMNSLILFLFHIFQLIAEEDGNLELPMGSDKKKIPNKNLQS